MGVIDGFAFKGTEGEADIAKCKFFLRAIGCKH
jgi:adenosine/AMP kinase